MTDTVIAEVESTVIEHDDGTVTVVSAGTVGPPGAQGADGPPGVGADWQGAWSSLTAYAEADVVSYQGSSWLALQASTNHAPAEDAYWTIVAEKGAQGDPGAAGSDGQDGQDGADGSPGSPGAAGADGKTVRNGTGAPGSGLGVDGDFYIDTAADAIYGPKTAGAWGSGVSLIGPTGPQGDPGADGADSTVPGPQGDPGSDGSPGADGRTILNGTGAPDNGDGADGDFYIDTAASDLYGPKASGSWPAGVSLVGSTGSAGATGAAGPGLATGGTTGQFARKNSGTDYDTTWGDIVAADVPALPESRITNLVTDLAAKVTANGAITGATKTKLTYDSKGLVTAGADATTADIADSTDKRYVTDAQRTVIGNTSGTNTGDQTSVSGNAGTATALQTARNIDGQAFDGTTNITVIAPGTHAATSKATPVDADEVPLVDSAASNVLKKLTWANLKATLKTYFDTLYAVVAHTTPVMVASGGSHAAGHVPDPPSSAGTSKFLREDATWVSMPAGKLGYAEITASITTTSTTLVDATGLSVTVTIGSRPVRITVACPQMFHSVAANRYEATIRDDTAGADVQHFVGTSPGINLPGGGLALIGYAAPAAGSRTYKVQFRAVSAGTATLAAGSGQPAYILVEEI